jgi:large subunit ribosomal protein L9
MAQKLLLLKDVEDLGRSGDVVNVRSGFARNFLLPQGFALPAEKGVIRLQARLQEERKKLAAIDRQEAENLANQLEGVSLEIIVKVDQEGHMYGSVSSLDIIELLQQQKNIALEKRWVLLKQSLKETGSYTINLKLKEGIPSSIKLKITPEAQPENAEEKKAAKKGRGKKSKGEESQEEVQEESKE